jgi:hypothetical protein
MFKSSLYLLPFFVVGMPFAVSAWPLAVFAWIAHHNK